MNPPMDTERLFTEAQFFLFFIGVSVEDGPPSKPGEINYFDTSDFPKGIRVNRPFLFVVRKRFPDIWCMMGRVQNLPDEAVLEVRPFHRRYVVVKAWKPSRTEKFLDCLTNSLLFFVSCLRKFLGLLPHRQTLEIVPITFTPVVSDRNIPMQLY